MASEPLPPSANSFLALVPSSPRSPNIVQCTESKVGEAFFGSFKGARITNIALLRYACFDVVALITDDKRAIAVVGDKDSFIAVEKSDGKDGSEDVNLAFRDDISHKRLAASFGTGRDVTYQDGSYVNGEVIGVDPAAKFANTTLKEGIEIDKIHPSWYTEDWMNIRSPKGEGITIRADKSKIRGAVAINVDGMDVLNIGDEHIETLQLAQPPLGSIPAKLQSPSK